METIEEVNERVETYPEVPRPITVETMFVVVKEPPPTVPYDVENEEKASPRKRLVETIEDVRDKVET